MRQKDDKVLVISYHFPPDAAVGALRPQKFAKYLPEFGWKPYILTIKKCFIEKIDAGRLKDVENVEIIRTDFWRTPLQVFLDVRDRIRRKKTASGARTIFSAAVDKKEIVKGRETLRARFRRYFAAFNWFPDDKMYWTIPAVVAGYRIIRREQISVIYATSPPNTVLIIGLLLSLFTGAKLVVDFRDPWVLIRNGIPDAVRCKFCCFMEKLAEKIVIRRAHTVVCTAERMTVAMQEKYSDDPSDKFVTILNGYDIGDMGLETTLCSDDSTYVITYLGTFYLDRNPEGFLQALRRAINEGIIPENGVEVRFIGAVNAACGKPLDSMLTEYGMEGIVTVTGQIPHREAISQMHEADLLLLLAPNQEFQIPGKALEYIGTQRPVLALTGEGSTADLIRTVNAGLVVDQDDVNGIYRALVYMYAQRQGMAHSWYGKCDMALYERKQLTKSLADIFNNMNCANA